MIKLLAINLHWLKGSDPDRDTCAHGNIDLIVNGIRIATGDEGCVSAAALFLLRSLERSHTSNDRIAEHLFPHCGHTMWKLDEQEDVLVLGCDSGFDWFVEHLENGSVKLSFESAGDFVVSKEQWQDAVCEFADSVDEFYVNSPSKIHSDEMSEKGFLAFREEWALRRQAVSNPN